MKTAIIFLGLAIITMTSSTASSSDHTPDKIGMNSYLNIEIAQGDAFQSNPEFENSKKVAPIADQTIINPETILNMRYERDVEELIEQDKKIIESTFENNSIFTSQEQSIEDVIIANNQITEDNIVTAVRPLYLERTIEDTILENNMVIGNDCKEVIQPLDFDKINKI